MKFLRHWGPALVWALMISIFSTDLFSAEHTSRIIIPILTRLFPGASAEALAAAHFLIRKSAHLCEYFLLSLLVLRGIRAGRGEWRWSWAVAAVIIAAGYAGLDELHQAFVPSRGPSMYDVMLDSAGAAVAQLFAGILTWRASRQSRTI